MPRSFGVPQKIFFTFGLTRYRFQFFGRKGRNLWSENKFERQWLAEGHNTVSVYYSVWKLNFKTASYRGVFIICWPLKWTYIMSLHLKQKRLGHNQHLKMKLAPRKRIKNLLNWKKIFEFRLYKFEKGTFLINRFLSLDETINGVNVDSNI